MRRLKTLAQTAAGRQTGSYSSRIAVVGGLLAVFLGLCIFRVAQLQLVQGQELAAKAATWQYGIVDFYAHRGRIVDRNGAVLALTVEARGIQIFRPALKYPEYVRDYLSGLLSLDPDVVERKMSCKGKYCTISRFVEPRYVQSVEAVVNYRGSDPEMLWKNDHLSGVQVARYAARIYPFKKLAGQVVGLARQPNAEETGGKDPGPMALKGQYGVEAVEDELLQGHPVSQKGLKRVKSGLAILPDNPDLVLEANTVVLTIDAHVQAIAEEELEKAVIFSQAKSGIAVIMDVATGELLAVAHYPFFNPNASSEYTGKELNSWVDRVFMEVFEPGSTLKPFVLAAALKEGVLELDDVEFAENGTWKVEKGNKPVTDHGQSYGFLPYWDCLKFSSNICFGKIGLKLGSARLSSDLGAFGFGRKTGVKPAREAAGILRTQGRWSDMEIANVGFGQGIAVTAIQLVSAMAALGNGGARMQPILIKEVVDPQGNAKVWNEPTVIGRPVSKEIADLVLRGLERVLDTGGTGERARVYGFKVAGKTGTAQKTMTVEDPNWTPEDGGKGPLRRSRYVDRWIGSFIGLIPSEAPRFVVLVAIDEPQTSHLGGMVAGPAFSSISSRLMTYLNIRPGYEAPHPVQKGASAKAESAAVEPAAGAEAPDEQLPEGLSGVGPTAAPNFAGMSMGEALRIAQEARVRLAAEGSGIAVSQEPAPGSAVGDWEEVRVRFAGHGTASGGAR